MSEDRRFGDLPTEVLGSDNLDGVMAQALVEAGTCRTMPHAKPNLH